MPVATLRIESAEVIFYYPNGYPRPCPSPTPALPHLFTGLAPRLTRLTTLTISRSPVDYGVPLLDFFQSLQLILYNCTTLRALSVSIAYCEHESSLSRELCNSILKYPQGSHPRYPALKEITVSISHRRETYPRGKIAHIWPLELLGAMLKCSSKTVTKLTVSATVCCPHELLLAGGWLDVTPLQHVDTSDMDSDYAAFKLGEMGKWEMPAVTQVVLSMDVDSWRVLDKYFAIPLAQVTEVGFNVGCGWRRWCEVVDEMNLEIFPNLQSLRVNSSTSPRELGRILCGMDTEAHLERCQNLSRIEAVIDGPFAPHRSDDSPYQDFLKGIKIGYGVLNLPLDRVISMDRELGRSGWSVIF
ncbi:hypothetical protein TWF481_006907 [Arthrobotrys musiformis]|uniref:F-box domain-containing protein n=1 Tax=Arthrobotrys musiformis TaxID=47236 RepID=A0AAV9WC80_9PEZI